MVLIFLIGAAAENFNSKRTGHRPIRRNEANVPELRGYLGRT
jgi:hypothetical protein